MSDPASDPPPNRDIRQQADQSHNATQIGHAGNVTIHNYGSQPPPEPPALSEREPGGPRRAIVVMIIGLFCILGTTLTAIVPGLLGTAPTATPSPSLTTTATLSATDSPTLVPAIVASESPVPSDAPPILMPTPAASDDSALSVTVPATDGIDLILYRDAASLTLYLPEQGTVSLDGLRFEVIQGGVTTAYPLTNLNFGLPLGALPTPLCLRLERSGTANPLPLTCDALRSRGSVITRTLADADSFMQDGRQHPLPILIYAGDVQLGIFGTDSAELHLSYPQ